MSHGIYTCTHSDFGESRIIIVPVDDLAYAIQTMKLMVNSYDSDVVAAYDLKPIGFVRMQDFHLVGREANIKSYIRVELALNSKHLASEIPSNKLFHARSSSSDGGWLNG